GDRRLAGPGGMEPGQGAEDAIFELRGDLSQQVDRPSWSDRELDKRTGSGERRCDPGDLVEGESGLAAKRAFVPRLEAEPGECGGRPLDRFRRAEAVDSSQRILIAAPDAPRRRLKDPAA